GKSAAGPVESNPAAFTRMSIRLKLATNSAITRLTAATSATSAAPARAGALGRPPLGDCRGGVVRGLGVSVQNANRGPFRRECAGDGFANACGSASYDRDALS